MVSVAENVQTLPQQQAPGTSIIAGVSINWAVIIPVVIGGILFIIFAWIVWKIVKKIRSNRKKKEDIEYYKYTIDLKNAQRNKNTNYKYRNFLTIWLTYKRAKVYARTKDGRKFIGGYDGELTKKEGYFIIALELKHSFFKRETDLVIFPYNLKKQLVEFNFDGTIDINCEGIDETLSSEYFSIPVFDNKSDLEKNQNFVNYSNDIMKHYFQEFSHQKAMKDLTIDYTNNVREATEINASIPYQRKTNSNLRE